MNDIRFAFRKLRQSPAFTAIAVLTLALGIGLNTAIFSLINDLFLRGLPFKEPRRVVHFFSNAPDGKLVDLPLSLPRFNVRPNDARHHLFPRRRPVETANDRRTSASRVTCARSKLSRRISG